MAVILTHLLAAYVILAASWLGRLVYQKARARMRTGDPLAKVKLYRVIAIDQVVTTLVVLWLWLSGGIPATRLGLGAPRSWWLSAGLAVVLGGLLVWSGIRLRPKAQKIRERYRDRAEAILPDTTQERSWFGAISVGAGISEELLFRGFLFYYLALWLPHINKLECVLVTSLIFGLGHLYQGWKGVVGTGVGGLLLAGLYVLSGNLLLPMVFHAVADLRVLMILPPESEALATAGEAA